MKPLFAAIVSMLLLTGLSAQSTDHPNFVVIFTADQGYGDLMLESEVTRPIVSCGLLSIRPGVWYGWFMGCATLSIASLVPLRLPFQILFATMFMGFDVLYQGRAIYLDASGAKIMESTKSLAISQEQAAKRLNVISFAYTQLHGEGELRLATMAAISNKFGIEIPAEAVATAKGEEESATGAAQQNEQQQKQEQKAESKQEMDTGSGYPVKTAGGSTSSVPRVSRRRASPT